MKNFAKKYGNVIIFACVFVVGVIARPGAFLSISNVTGIISQAAIAAICCLGMTFVLMTGGIDLSVGSVAAAAGVTAVQLANRGLPVVLCVAVALALGVAVGLVNGLVVANTDLPPFIITLSTQITVRGVSYILTGGQPSQCVNENFNMLGSGSLLGLPIPVLIVVGAMVILFFVMNRTCFGRHVYAVGGNRESARYAGVNVKWVQVRVFMISGLMAALAGVVLAARLYSGQPNVGEGFERDAIAASVLGGTSMGGGVGTLGGTVIGVLIIGVLNNGMNLLRIDTYWQYVVKGVVILGAVYMDYLKRVRASKK